LDQAQCLGKKLIVRERQGKDIRPLLTIILPIGDPRPTLTKTIDSVLSSDEQEFQLLISDNTQGKLLLEERHVQDRRVHRVVQPNRISMADHWRELLKISSGEWICFMGADDGVVTRNLPKLITFLRTSKYKVVSTHRVEIDWDQNFLAKAWTFPASKCSEDSSILYWPTRLASLFPHFFFDLPMPYNKAIFRREEVADFLESHDKLYELTPDYFLAFFLAGKTRVGEFLDLPVFVHGGSEHSNGYQYTSGNDSEYSKDFINRINFNLQIARNLPNQCQSAWLANSFLLYHFQSKRSSNFPYWDSLNKALLSKFYEVWVARTCTSCQPHASKNSKAMIRVKQFTLDKFASLIRNYILPMRPNHQIPVHPGIRESGHSEITLKNLGSFLFK
jgi:glycosyltransferase involved in cell wall biosynthesis